MGSAPLPAEFFKEDRMMYNNVSIAMLLTLLAGLATGIGSIFALFTSLDNKKFLSAVLGFSAGIMIYISFEEMFAKSKEYLCSGYGELTGIWLAVISFLGGMGIIMIIDNFIPSPESDLTAVKAGKHSMHKMGLLTASAIAIHNFPEGLATFATTLNSPTLGIAMACAIAIHNIPEGIITAVPILCSTGNKKTAFLVSFFSGLTEPLGAIIGYLLLRPFLNDTVFGILFGIIAGIMIYISVEELVPMAREYDKGNSMIFGIIAGMAVMASSLILIM